MTNNIYNIVKRTVTRFQGFKDAVYLDTNAWILLSRTPKLIEPFKNWVDNHNLHIWISRFQIAELSRNKNVAREISNLANHFAISIYDRDQEEFKGDHWKYVNIPMDIFLSPKYETPNDKLLSLFNDSSNKNSLQSVDRDGEEFSKWLIQAISVYDIKNRNWNEFNQKLEKWVKQTLTRMGYEYDNKKIIDRNRYIGIKLSYGVLFARYYINNQSWKKGDYIDYLHSADMAYSKVCITENNLKEVFNQLKRKTDLLLPEEWYSLNWLKEL